MVFRIFILLEQSNGIYTVNYTILSENKGGFIIEISAFDQFSNNASTTKIIQIIHKKESSFPLTTILAIIAVLIIVIFVAYFLQKRFSILRLQDVQEELKEVQRLQNEAVKNYYKKGSISRETYDMLRKEHSERLAELKREMRKKKKKVRKNIEYKKVDKT